MFTVANSYYPSANVFYYPNLSASLITIQWSGNRSLVVGKNPESFDDEIAQLVERTFQNRPVKKAKADKKAVEVVAA
ncbi:MAG: hypothetical protein NWE99_08490 [Candidatus Bathyarchaeota archaeon]|nr:hypothetical protein [Candidatus Bathyarchaeota archaeon]